MRNNASKDAARSKLMRSVRQKHTQPELQVRRYLFRRGLRYSLHSKGLPGRPDLVLKHYNTVIFVNGCFWHGHHCKHGSTRAKTNRTYWSAKIAGNRRRDQRKARELRSAGWSALAVWECEVSAQTRLDKLVLRIRSRRSDKDHA